MKLTFLALLLGISTQVVAQEMTCLDKLMPASRHSGLHTLSREECSRCTNGLDAGSASTAFHTFIRHKLLCRTNEIEVKIDPVCQWVTADVPESNVCFVYTNLGHFVINRDSNRTFNIIFTRSDRFGGQAD
jgi:hypothetical protein